MFKLMFGFLAGVFFALATILFGAIGVWVGINTPDETTTTPTRPTPTS